MLKCNQRRIYGHWKRVFVKGTELCVIVRLGHDSNTHVCEKPSENLEAQRTP